MSLTIISEKMKAFKFLFRLTLKYDNTYYIQKGSGGYMEINKAISLRIRSLCTEKGWTINELVRRANVNQSTVSEFMRGSSKYPQMNTIVKIAHGFGMSLSEFFDDELFTDLKTK